ncbi:MAG TPA: hypothetical protein VK327_15575 [Candidatus Paceibacterota bacterium]|nr:hypothetical protein [Candidatus Paceibacterota bacterium]
MSAPNPELLRSLGRLVRGLSALFWGLPLALIVCAGTAMAGWFKAYGVMPALGSTGLLLFGLWQLGSFQKQERPWRAALAQAQLLALVNFGLSPFLYWWNHLPQISFFGLMSSLMAFCALLFLFSLNLVLVRLGAMLPDEALRMEIRHYTSLNRNLLIALITIVTTYLVMTRIVVHFFPQIPHLPAHMDILSLQIAIPALGVQISSGWVIWLMTCLLVLLPLAMTMALIWKTKEVILENVFGGQ